MPNPYKKEPKIISPSLTKDDDITKYIKKIKNQRKGAVANKSTGGRIGFAHGSKRPKGGWTA